MIPELWQPYFVLAIIFLLFFTIYREYLRPSISFLLAVLIFIITGIIDTKEAVAGLSNPSILSVIVLILITTGLRKNFRIEAILDNLIFKVKSYRMFLLRMMGQVAVLSSVINNTPVVALLTPYIFDWGKRNNISPSKLLIPLSYGTIMGGMITVIGTSTTLVLNGFMMDFEKATLHPVDLLIIGPIVAVFGIGFIAFGGHKLLPNKKNIIDDFSKNKREYLIETTLQPGSKMAGQTVSKAGLRNLKGIYLVEIIREGTTITPVKPSEYLQPNDVLIFAGDTENIDSLINSNMGIALPRQARTNSNSDIEVVEAVISTNSSLIGKTIKETGFRNRYDAAVIAIHRDGEKVSGKIGDVRLSSGDLLLLYAGTEFKERVDLFRDLFVISKLREIPKIDNKKYYALGLTALSIIALQVFGNFTLFAMLLTIFSFMVGFRLITMQDLKRELDLNLVAILVFSLALGQVIIKTGTGNMLARELIDLLLPYGEIAILVGITLFTTILTSLITNVAAVSIAFPITYSICQNLEVNGSPFYLALAFAASAAFLTPIGYQTNLIVFGPGGYTFRDFFKVGLPITVIYLTVMLIAVIIRYNEVFFY